MSWAPAQAAPAPPQITSEGASAVTATDATLEAEIDPGGSAAGAYYQFQISEFPTEFPDELACPPPPESGPFLPCIGPESETALPIGHIEHQEGAASVSLDLMDAGMALEPGTTYYFRVVAASAILSEDTIEWEKPAVGGVGSSFTTLAPSSQPQITSEGASAVTATDATLEAEIDPGGSAAGAYYQFQISEFPTEFPDELACPPESESGPFLPCEGPESETALPIGHIDHQEGAASVSLDLMDAGMALEPGTTYYFRVVAASAILSEDTIEWEKPAVGGVGSSFTTLAAASQPQITGEGVSAITATDATLEAEIDPGGSVAGAYYQFQISEFPTEFPDELACPSDPESELLSLPLCMGPESETALPIGHIDHQEGAASVSLDLADAGMTLEPGTTYYFRVVAASAILSEDTIEWEKPAVGGVGSSFTTMPCPLPPDSGSPSSGLPPGPGTESAEPAPRPRHHHHRRHHHRPFGRLGIAQARIAI